MKYIAYLIAGFIISILLTSLIALLANAVNLNLGDQWNLIILIFIFLILFIGIALASIEQLNQQEQIENNEKNHLKERELEIEARELELKETKLRSEERSNL